MDRVKLKSERFIFLGHKFWTENRSDSKMNPNLYTNLLLSLRLECLNPMIQWLFDMSALFIDSTCPHSLSIIRHVRILTRPVIIRHFGTLLESWKQNSTHWHVTKMGKRGKSVVVRYWLRSLFISNESLFLYSFMSYPDLRIWKPWKDLKEYEEEKFNCHQLSAWSGLWCPAGFEWW